MTYDIISKIKALGYDVEFHKVVDSTNILAMQRAKEGHDGFLWIVAEEQKKGRARRGRSWNSPKGNLYASLLLKKSIKPEFVPYLGFVAGISMAEAVQHFAPLYYVDKDIVQLKWPNDILLQHLKASGILLETMMNENGDDALVIGIGVNIAQSFAGAPYPTTDLHSVGIKVDMYDFLGVLVQQWAKNYALFQTEDGISAIRDKWMSYAAFLGQTISVSTPQGVIEGCFDGIDHGFNCIIIDENGKKNSISAGDIYFGAFASRYKQNDASL